MGIRFFGRNVFMFVLPVAVLASGFVCWLDMDYLGKGLYQFGVETLVIMAATLLFIVVIGIKNEERRLAYNLIRVRLQKILG